MKIMTSGNMEYEILSRKRILIISSLLVLSLAPIDAFAKSSKTAPTGAERARQFKAALKDCQKRYSGGAEVTAEWGTNYGRTGWWCLVRG
jgi:hypothetical protein